jgi:O-antigen ligase
MIADFPLTGIGLNTFPVVQQALYPALELRGGQWPTAHNLYLQTALDLGLPGLFFFIWLLGAFLRELGVTYNRTTDAFYAFERTLVTILAASVLVWLINGLIDTPIRLGDKFGIWLWLELGVAFALPRLIGRESAAPGVDTLLTLPRTAEREYAGRPGS